MSDPTPDQVRGLWGHMQTKYGSAVANKSDSALMQAAAKILGMLGIEKPEDFLKSYTTTIDGTIYVPFEIGTANDAWGLWDQVIVCAHEHHHIEQQRKVGTATFDWRYLSDGGARARFEAEAYASAVELDFWRYGRLDYTPESIAQNIRGYGCSDDDLLIAGDTLRSLGATILAGGVVNESSCEVIAWLEQHAPGVREVT